MTMVYCMRCQKLVDKKLAVDILKTGFYRKDIPAASQCADCLEAEEGMNGGRPISGCSKES